MGTTSAFDIVEPGGRRVSVQPRSDADTIGDLLAALGRPDVERVLVDGRLAMASQRLIDVRPLRAGSRLEVPPPSRPSAPTPAAVVEVAVIAGPSCRGWTVLPPGRHGIGRSEHCSLRLADDQVELHHALLDVGSAGDVRFTQLTGRVPARIDGELGRAGARLAPGARLEIGSSVLTVRPIEPGGAPPAAGGAGSVVPGDDRWRLVVRRGPDRDDARTPPELIAPDPPAEHPAPPATGLIGAVLAVAGALVVGVVMGHPMFAIFGLVGAAASLGTWLAGVGTARRRRRRDRRRHREATDHLRAAVEQAVDAAAAHHRRRHRTVVEALDELDPPGGRIWERRPDAEQRLEVTVGTGQRCWLPDVEGWETVAADVAVDLERRAIVPDAKVVATLAPGDGLAVHGPVAGARAVVRAILVQLAVWYGPADWQVIVVSPDPERWAWAGWLPHAAPPGGAPRVVTPGEIDVVAARLTEDRTTVFVTDDPAAFDARTGPARRLIASHRAIVVAVVDREHTVPAICDRVLRLGSTGRAEWSPGRPGDPSDVRIEGLDEAAAEPAARALAALTDPEDPTQGVAAIPRDLRFVDLDEPAADGGGDVVDRIVARWAAAGADPAPRTPLGVSGDGLVDVDLVRDGPHGLIAGTTGSGKSELLRTLVVGLASRCGPDHLSFVLVDYKGGSTFDACARLPHTVGVVTDLDEGGAARALVSLEAELGRRERLLRAVGAADLVEYRRRRDGPALARLVLVVDEFAALAHELPDFLSALVGIAQRGRSLGVHLLLATQRPAGVVDDDVRANTNLRIALRLHDAADARDVVGDELPATLPRGVPGRAVVRLGPSELVVFQAARCSGPAARETRRLTVVDRATAASDVPLDEGDGPTELAATVEAIRRAAERLGIPLPHRPWLDPLPSVLDPEVVASECDADDPADAVGLLDDPERQARRLLRWEPKAGNLALVGPHGSGLTSTLVALAAALGRTRASERLHLFVIDAIGDPALDGLAAIAHCGAVVRARESERLHRLLARLDADLDGRSSDDPRVVLLVDGFDSLRATLAGLEHADSLARLERIAADGPAVGVSVVAAGPEVARIECVERWEFGERAGTTGRSVPGRVRCSSSGLVGQVARGAPGLAALPDRSGGRGPAGVDVLAAHVGPDDLGASWSSGPDGAATDHLVIGRAADTLAAAALAVPQGDHVFVGGPAATGKTTALHMLRSAWRELHPDGLVVEVDHRRPLPAAELGRYPTLIVVDDADRVDDDLLARIAAGHHPAVTLLIAARPDAVRARYGHWTRDVARRRCGVLLTAPGDVDGELLGVTLPRRAMIPARPGLGWVVDVAGARLAQLALPGDGAVTAAAGQSGGSSPRR